MRPAAALGRRALSYDRNPSVELQRRPAHCGIEQCRADAADGMGLTEQTQGFLAVALDNDDVRRLLARIVKFVGAATTSSSANWR
jgi:hypothetical protein